MSAIVHLVWKEYRSQRNLWIVLLTTALACQLLSRQFADPEGANIAWWVLNYAKLFPWMFALATGAMLFAGEQEERTANLLRAFPLSRGQVFAAKFGFGLAALALLFGVLLTSGILLTPQPYPEVIGPWSWLWTMYVLSALHVFAWGVFYSILTGRMLPTLLLGPLTMVVSMSLPRPFSDATLLLVCVADYFLTGRWLAGKPFALPAFFARARVRSVPQRFLFIGESSTPWKRSLSRLAWLEWRNAKPFGRWALVAGIVAITVGSLKWFRLAFAGADLPLFYICLVPLMAGAWSFHGDQTQRRHRLAAQRGLSPDMVWLSKHVVWLAVALFLTMTLQLFYACYLIVATRLSGDWFARNSHWAGSGLKFFNNLIVRQPAQLEPNEHFVSGFLLWIFIAYGCGQLASLFLSRVITAVILALTLFGGVFFWWMLMVTYEIPVVWSVFPIGLMCFVVTLFRTSDWLLERAGWRRWLKIAAVIVPVTIMLLTAIVVLRITEIPIANRQALSSAPRSSLSPDLDDRLRIVTDSDDDSTTPGGQRVQDAAPANSNSQTAVNLSASRMSKVNLTAITDHSDDVAAFQLRHGAILAYAAALTRDGRLDDAFREYVQALRITQQRARDGSIDKWSSVSFYRAMTQRAMDKWLIHPDQTSERLHAAMQQLETVLLDIPAQSLKLREEYQFRRALFERDWSLSPEQLREEYGLDNDDLEERLIWLRRFFPWEKWRILRLLDAVAAESILYAEASELKIAQGLDVGAWEHQNFLGQFSAQYSGQVIWIQQNVGPKSIDNPNPRKWINSTTVAWRYSVAPFDRDSIRSATMEAQRRGWLIKIALVAWRREHKKLPERLDALVPAFLSKLPIDPWTGAEFEYRPQGFPAVIKPQGASEEESIGTSRPIVWSAGPRGGHAIEISADKTPDRVATYGLSDRFSERLNSPIGWLPFGADLTFEIP